MPLIAAGLSSFSYRGCFIHILSFLLDSIPQASLEFNLPLDVMKATLETAKLTKIW